MYDIIVLGLGPAGSTFSRLIADPSLKIAAIDKKSGENGSFQKPCGGLLAPDAQKALAQFGLTLPKDILVDPQIFSVRTIDLDSGLERYYQRFYMNTDRNKFDQWLISLIPSSVELFLNTTICSVMPIVGGYRVKLFRNGQHFFLDAEKIVDAEGANSIVRKTFFPKKKIRRYVAIQQWFPEENKRPFYSCIFDSQNTDCYSWSISKDGFFILGGAYPAKDCRRRFEAQKNRLRQLGVILGEPVKTEACLVLRPSSPFQFCTGDKNIFLIGEAAGFISPSSLEGISSGIISAEILSTVLKSSSASPNRDYHKKTRRLRRKLLGKLLKCPFMFWPLLRKLVMKSRVKSFTPVNH